jgi:hypothetical protein
MMTYVFEPLSHLLAYLIALLIIAGVVAIARFLDISWPLEFGSLIDEIIAWRRQRHAQRFAVNVALKDPKGRSMRFGPLVKVTMHNGKGSVYTLKAGFFHGCDGRVIQVGARVQLDVQDGLFQEEIRVQPDKNGDKLVLKSRHTVSQIMARITRDKPDAA